MIFVFYFFAAILIWLSYRSLVGGIEYLRFFRQELAKPRSDFTPFVSIIAPCRGVDDGMHENLQAIFDQDYPEYEIIFVVDDENDDAYSVIEQLISSRSTNARSEKIRSKAVFAKLIVASKATISGQKVENLREALLHADDRSQAFVFVDSDARASSDWLRSLVAPLENEDVGASTGYRWFLPKRQTFASELNSAWNASVASALGANTASNFCWGGAMSIRRAVFERLDIRGKWRGTVSDDFAVTRAMNESQLPIVFVPQAICVSAENCTLTEMLEFTTRQMKITRVYAPKLWILSFIGSALFNFVMITAVMIVIFGGKNVLPVGAAVITLISVLAFSIGKAYLRLKAMRIALPHLDGQLRKQTFYQATLFLFAQPVFLFNCIAAAFSRRLTWRGTTYELKSPNETVIISGR